MLILLQQFCDVARVSRCLLKLGVDAHHARVTVGDVPAIRVFWE